MRMYRVFAAGALLVAATVTAPPDAFAAVHGWLNWRGPQQNGTSTEKNLPDKIDAKNPLWVKDFPGASTAVVAGGKVYIVSQRDWVFAITARLADVWR